MWSINTFMRRVCACALTEFAGAVQRHLLAQYETRSWPTYPKPICSAVALPQRKHSQRAKHRFCGVCCFVRAKPRETLVDMPAPKASCSFPQFLFLVLCPHAIAAFFRISPFSSFFCSPPPFLPRLSLFSVFLFLANPHLRFPFLPHFPPLALSSFGVQPKPA